MITYADNNEKFNELREKFPEFIFRNYEYYIKDGKLFIKYHFQMGEYNFYPKWEFPLNGNSAHDLGLIQTIIVSLGLAELVSYWKCACPPVVYIQPAGLSTWQINWWKKLYFNGLSEFFYRNKIKTDFDSFMTIKAYEKMPECENIAVMNFKSRSGVLVPVGGGKDSAVTLELIKKTGEKITPFIINSLQSAVDCVKAADIENDKIIAPKRTLDNTLLELNKRGFLNGHTPLSAVIAFSSVLAAALKGIKYVALSNESSANESYVEGTAVNHQYSKSAEFEKDFREYCQRIFGSFGRCPEYFSLLRPWSEWQITKEFVKYPKYFKVFRSCNLGSKTNSWCLKCAKCLYIYILLAGFLDDQTLFEIFGCDMLKKRELENIFKGLVLDGVDKPFECVGTKSEIRFALDKALERREKIPYLLEKYREFKQKYNFKTDSPENYFDSNNFIPEQFIALLKE